MDVWSYIVPRAVYQTANVLCGTAGPW